MSKVFTVLPSAFLKSSVTRLDPWTKIIPAECGENKVYRTGGACEPSCYGTPRFCTMQLIIGCFCKEGFYRTIDGRCVADCSDDPWAGKFSTCGENEVIGTGDLCERSCYVNIEHCPPAHEHACICKEGFYRTLFGKCVADCSADEFFGR
ncbi:hypothetical protein NECAME_08567 [Necator americanus]|uniref:TIL domain-containing protein n=1 Tax=Necator americanus TaxID=51031 RepID=W2TJK5_NECAM|nr:hypothetical protein NECAME_08567 [Necator americanus]ETN81346.1 hypothetical protein NECAME_08567 [Necator americanus]